MSVVHKLASSLHRRDEVPNQELAKEIATSGDNAAVKELVELLTGKNKDFQSDSIKVLYEIGALRPNLIAVFASDFVTLLDSKNNRLQWGAMTALHSIASENPKTVYPALAKLAEAADRGSVITRDHYVDILTVFCAVKEYSDEAFTLLHEQMLGCPSNQLPMYAENALPIIDGAHKGIFIQTFTARLGDFEKESKRKRLEKVLKKLSA